LQTAVASNVVMAGGGEKHSCLLDTNQAVKCAGRDNFGQLGDNIPETASTSSFLTVNGIADVTTISVSISLINEYSLINYVALLM
jgi:alpha-tubulin suppressor-like RCC1 family protein